MKVLSLFDGISCGMIALERAGVNVELYDAYEIEKNAISISTKNYPTIAHKGDVFKAVYTSGEYDLLIGGSPCTYWSIAQKADARETTSSGLGWELFSQYVRALKEVKPKYFLYENNKSMSNEIREEITRMLGVEPVYINSADFSAQSRQRLYWTNIPLRCWTPCTISLNDVLESGHADREKALCLTRRYAGFTGSDSYLCRRYFGKSFGQAVFEKDRNEVYKMWKANPRFTETDTGIRPLTVTECERLQTLPDGYTDVDGISNAIRIGCIGNGWTVDVIAHIFKGLKGV